MKIIDVTAAIIKKGNKFLIAKRGKGRHLECKWEFPGGKVEDNERPETCLQRELEEEFGITVEINDFFAESIFEYKDRKIRLLGYNVKYVAGEFQLNVHDEIRWISIDDFDKYDFAEADIPLVKKIVTNKKANSKLSLI